MKDLVDHLFRHHSAKIVATLTRVFGSRHLDLAEDVVQDALVKALQQWPFKGVPENPAGWLTLVAKNRALDLLRRDASLADKAEELELALPHLTSPAVASSVEMDDQLALILMCCHPALPVEYQIALTLKTACGFSTAEIARAFLTPQTTIAQRLVRAKRQIRDHDIVIDPPGADDLPARIDSVLRVIYLLFNEGYAASSGDDLVRADLCEEALRLGTLVIDQSRVRLPAAHALLALMMLQAARLPARTLADGTLAVLAKQNRELWDRKLIGAGMRHFGASAHGDTITTYHLQAEIAAVHATAGSDDDTDWSKLVELYNDLYKLEPTPIVLLNRAIAISRCEGPHAGLTALDDIDPHPSLRNYHLLPAVAAELWRQAGDNQRAAQAYQRALECSCSAPERAFLETQLERLN
ncbi:MAG TPA: sigma-70 family RNA polymerase sigma factor [Pyrinomonadaceae bacterium]|nr:sigma-70 family RNA polymerase sigma factor [Pyrinomonadaceae bacterium]